MLHRSFSADAFIAACRSWKHFRAAAAALPPESRDAAFVALSGLLLRTAPLYRNVLDPKGVWKLGEVPADVRSSLRLPSEGIDLVARTRDGTFWAIKATFVAEGEEGPDIAAVAAFNTAAFRRRKDIVHALVVHSADDDIAVPGNRTGQIGVMAWNELGPAGWRRILAAAKGAHVGRPAGKKPRPHQVAAIAKARKHFKVNARGRLLMPCGTGKSLTGILIAETLKASTIIVAAPSLSLIRQNLGGWAKEFDAKGLTFDCLCVCSDKTVGGGEDDVAEDASGLGVEVTTDVGEIVARLQRPRNRPLVVFTTYHSSPLLAEASRKARMTFDFAILDEAHKTVGAADRDFATLLDDGRVSISKRVSMTATERVYRGDRTDILSMDSEADYGTCFHQLSFKAAIEQKLICDYKVVTFFVGEAQIRDLIENRSSVRLDHEGKKAVLDANAMSLAAGMALKSAVREYGVRHAISFHRSIKAADDFRIQQDGLNRFPELGPVVANFHVSGRFSTSERTRIMDRFAASEYGCVANARCLTEGVDVPKTDCILFEGTRQSVIDITQAVGRALRNYPGKEFGYILIPVVVPEGIAFDEFVQTTGFRKVAQTLTAMSTQDERIAAEFRAVAAGKPPKDGGIVSIKGDVPASIGMEFSAFAQAVRTTVWSKLGKASWRPFKEARSYARALGFRDNERWRTFVASGRKPLDIPSRPAVAYADEGWKGWADWLGTSETEGASWRPYEDAQSYVAAIGFGSVKEWRQFTMSDGMPLDIPERPDVAYAGQGWTSWTDWLGIQAAPKGAGLAGNRNGVVLKKKERTWRPFEQARAFVRALCLKNVKAWKAFAKSDAMPADIPNAADRIYAKDGWKDWGDWLGTGTVADKNKKRRPYEEARAFAHGLRLEKTGDWHAFVKTGRKPADIPSRPDIAYPGQFVSYGDWIGKGFRNPKKSREP